MSSKDNVREQDQPFCWEIKNCGELERRQCAAYRARKNCWEVEGTALDGNERGVCETCPVILSRIARSIAQAMRTTAARPRVCDKDDLALQ